MDTKFFDAVKHLIQTDRLMSKAAAKNLSIFVNNVAAKQKEVQKHNKKASEAYDRGTKITKHRIPL